MKNSRPLLIVLTVITVVGISLGAVTFLNRAISEHVYVYNCGIIDYKPQTLTPFCADAGVAVGNLQWDSWGAKGATGTGLYGVNLCVPTCAAGKWKFTDVKVSLSNSIKDKGKTVLTRIDVVTPDNKNLPQQNLPRYGWNLETEALTVVK